MAIDPNAKFIPLKNPGSRGWNVFNEPSAIDDLELADAQNISYDKGFVTPREGSTKLYTKPSGESGTPLQLIRAQTSDGVEYSIAVYANHFYLWHPTTKEWIRINNSYVPTETTLYYGNVNWQNGRGDDRLYVCNGVDDFMRWDMCVNVVNGAHAAGATTVTLVDGTRFPASGGTLILKSSGGTFFTEAYTSRSGNVFTLTGTLDNALDDASPATLDMIQKGSMEIGKHITKHQRRLLVANYYGGETVIQASVQGSPEDFSLASTIAGAFTQTIADGNGEITGLHDFGKFLVIEKEDSLHAMRLDVASDLGSKLVSIDPLLSGDSVGPINMPSTIKVFNELYFPTRNNGFFSLTPETSGDSASVKVTPISQKIDPFVKKMVDFTNARSATAKNRLYWSLAAIGASQNTIVLEFNMLRNAWVRHYGWGAVDFVEKDDEVLYLDSSGDIYQINDGTYNDNNNEYLASATFKRFDFGEIGRPKSNDLLYVEGFMTPATEFFIDIYFNENGTLGKQTYRINKDTDGIIFSDPITDAQGSFILGNPILGMVSLQGIGSVSTFRCYLGINVSKAFFNIQARVYGTRAAFWGITGMSFTPQLVPVVPQEMIVAPEISS